MAEPICKNCMIKQNILVDLQPRVEPQRTAQRAPAEQLGVGRRQQAAVSNSSGSSAAAQCGQVRRKRPQCQAARGLDVAAVETRRQAETAAGRRFGRCHPARPAQSHRPGSSSSSASKNSTQSPVAASSPVLRAAPAPPFARCSAVMRGSAEASSSQSVPVESGLPSSTSNSSGIGWRIRTEWTCHSPAQRGSGFITGDDDGDSRRSSLGHPRVKIVS